jgi:cytochrome c553
MHQKENERSMTVRYGRTKRVLGLATVLLLAYISEATRPAYSADTPPAWAYPMPSPDFKHPPIDDKRRHPPDSSVAYTDEQLKDRFLAKDWHPDEHPSMPDIVAHGRKPDVFACGHCHRADGPGGPENSSLAGLPASYIIQQIHEFRSGARKSSVPQRIPASLMVSLSRAISDDELATAAAYFSSLAPRKTIKVVETNAVPKTSVAGMVFAASLDGGQEPIGQRIVEIPDDLDLFEAYDSHAKFTAYVPVGSIANGEMLATTGGAGKTIQCGTCHGPDLKGLGPVPAIAGRSPSYIVRQLYDMKHGERTGSWSPLMAKVVAQLEEEDLVALAAYLASREP